MNVRIKDYSTTSCLFVSHLLFLCHNLSHSIRHRYSTETRFHLKVILMVIGLSHSGTMVKSSRIVVYILIHTYIPKE